MALLDLALTTPRWVISSERSRVRVFVIPTDEEAMIARQTLAVLDNALATVA